ncbi:mitochondrial amidoxime reducing component 2-like isoform X2 [Uloborus diversus]|nr:mitochondrial amidoxime reducing component 2-like isoform X2 [Uloborus diversus]
MMTSSWKTYAFASVLALTTVGVLVWRKKKKTYVKVGKISKLILYPVKSLKGVEVTHGNCAKKGFEVNGILDRQYMIVTKDHVLLSQTDAPRLALLTPSIQGNFLLISGPDVESLKIPIKKSVSSSDKIIECSVIDDVIKAIDVGDEAASWFQSFLKILGVRMVQFHPELPVRKYTKKDQFFAKLRKEQPIGFQNLSALHIVSTASLEDLNSRVDKMKVSEKNFRPSILVEGCKPFEEDSWRHIKFGGAEVLFLIPTGRCLSTTNDPETAVLSQKEPLVTLRKYRIPKDPALQKKTGSRACFGIHCSVVKPGEVKVGDDIFAVVGEQPDMIKRI